MKFGSVVLFSSIEDDSISNVLRFIGIDIVGLSMERRRGSARNGWKRIMARD